MVVAAAVVTTMLNLFVDVQAKLRKEFRNYGANIVVVARDGQTLAPNVLQKASALLAGRGLAGPFAYAVARTTSGQSIVVSGTDFDQVRNLNFILNDLRYAGLLAVNDESKQATFHVVRNPAEAGRFEQFYWEAVGASQTASVAASQY